MSQLHPCPDIYVSSQSRSRLTSTQVWRCMYTFINALSHLQPGHSPRLRFTSTHVLISASHHHPGDVSPPSSSRNLHLNSIHVLSQSHSGLKMCLTSIQALSQIHPSYIILLSPPSKYRLASNQVLIFISHLPPGANIYVSHLTTS